MLILKSSSSSSEIPHNSNDIEELILKTSSSSSENPHASNDREDFGPFERSKMNEQPPASSVSSAEGPHTSSDTEDPCPLEKSKMNEQHTPSFRFTDLAAETRNQIYRYILIQGKQPVEFSKYRWGPTLKDLAIIFTNRLTYFEAMPIFLSENAFSITGRRKEQVWLRRMRPEGRSELRNITLVVSEEAYNHDFNLYNALSLCPRVHLTLKVRPCRLVKVSKENSLRQMHGYVLFWVISSCLVANFSHPPPFYTHMRASPLLFCTEPWAGKTTYSSKRLLLLPSMFHKSKL